MSILAWIPLLSLRQIPLSKDILSGRSASIYRRKEDTLAFGTFTTPVQWQEGEYTVTRTNSWSPPGDHPTGAGMKLYVKDGILEKVEGDPEQSITKGAMPIRMLSLPEYVYSPYRILHPMKRDPEKRGDDSAWEQCSWDEAYDLICDNVRRITDEYGSNAIVTFVGTGREAGNWGPTMSCRVFYSLVWRAHPMCWALPIRSWIMLLNSRTATTTLAGGALRSSWSGARNP